MSTAFARAEMEKCIGELSDALESALEVMRTSAGSLPDTQKETEREDEAARQKHLADEICGHIRLYGNGFIAFRWSPAIMDK